MTSLTEDCLRSCCCLRKYSISSFSSSTLLSTSAGCFSFVTVFGDVTVPFGLTSLPLQFTCLADDLLGVCERNSFVTSLEFDRLEFSDPEELLLLCCVDDVAVEVDDVVDSLSLSAKLLLCSVMSSLDCVSCCRRYVMQC